MKKNWLPALLLTFVMILVMRWAGSSLVTPVSPGGILELEFAWDAVRLQQLKLFWNPSDLLKNILFDFIFIFAYTWFFISASSRVSEQSGWLTSGSWVAGLGTAAGLFDVLENFLMVMIFQEKFAPGLLKVVFVIAAIKFLLAALVLLYLLVSVVFIAMKKKAVS